MDFAAQAPTEVHDPAAVKRRRKPGVNDSGTRPAIARACSTIASPPAVLYSRIKRRVDRVTSSIATARPAGVH